MIDRFELPRISLSAIENDGTAPYFYWPCVRIEPTSAVGLHPVFNYRLDRLATLSAPTAAFKLQIPAGYRLLGQHVTLARWDVADRTCPDIVSLEPGDEVEEVVPTFAPEAMAMLRKAAEQWDFSWCQVLFILRLYPVSGRSILRLPFAISISRASNVPQGPVLSPSVVEPDGTPMTEVLPIEIERWRDTLRYSVFDYQDLERQAWPFQPSLSPMTWLKTPEASLQVELQLGSGLQGDHFKGVASSARNPALPGYPEALQLHWNGVTDPLDPVDPRTPPRGFLGSGTSRSPEAITASVAYRGVKDRSYPQAATFHTPLQGEAPVFADPTVIYDPPEEEPGGDPF